MYKSYGEAFKEIRQQEGMSLAELEYISGVPKSTISQFENGHSLISFEKLEEILEALYVTIGDYTFAISNGEIEYFISQFQDIEIAFIQNRMKNLQKIYESNIKNGEKGTDLIAYCAKSCYMHLIPKEISYIEDYFLSKHYWSLFDLYTIFYVIEQLNIDLLIELIKELFLYEINRNTYLTRIPTYREPMVWVLVRSCLRFIRSGRISVVEELLAQAEKNFLQSDLTSKICFQYIKGCLYFIEKSEIEGRQMVNQTLSQLVMIDALEIESLLTKAFIRLKEIKNKTKR